MFRINHIYNRRLDIHDKFGGNPQSGISNCPNYPYIFIFTSKSGIQHGYQDFWDDENYFHYTGEGQDGNMDFVRGNRALVDHERNGKSVFLFENIGKGLYKFIDELTLVDFYFFETPDSSGKNRMGIKFKFKSSEGKSLNANGKPRKAIDYNMPTKTEREGLTTSRVGQGWYRTRLLYKWDYKCAVTNFDFSNVLIASHIVPWRNSSDQERLDIENGIILSPNLDAFFDKHLISFDDNRKIIFSNLISERDLDSLGINPKMKLREITKGMHDYLERHRKKLHEDN